MCYTCCVMQVMPQEVKDFLEDSQGLIAVGEIVCGEADDDFPIYVTTGTNSVLELMEMPDFHEALAENGGICVYRTSVRVSAMPPEMVDEAGPWRLDFADGAKGPDVVPVLVAVALDEFRNMTPALTIKVDRSVALVEGRIAEAVH